MLLPYSDMSFNDGDALFFSISNCVYAGVKYHLVYVVYHLLLT